MMVIRPIAANDLAALFKLASKTGIGLTTLPANEELLQKRIDASLASFRICNVCICLQIRLLALYSLDQTKLASAIGFICPRTSHNVHGHGCAKCRFTACRSVCVSK